MPIKEVFSFTSPRVVFGHVTEPRSGPAGQRRYDGLVTSAPYVNDDLILIIMLITEVIIGVIPIIIVIIVRELHRPHLAVAERRRHRDVTMTQQLDGSTLSHVGITS